jgi:hypothetical protein
MKDFVPIAILLITGVFGVFQFGRRYKSNLTDKNSMKHAVGGFWFSIYIIVLSIIVLVKEILSLWAEIFD